jgi:hypothetical protein
VGAELPLPNGGGDGREGGVVVVETRHRRDNGRQVNLCAVSKGGGEVETETNQPTQNSWIFKSLTHHAAVPPVDGACAGFPSLPPDNRELNHPPPLQRPAHGRKVAEGDLPLDVISKTGYLKNKIGCARARREEGLELSEG